MIDLSSIFFIIRLLYFSSYLLFLSFFLNILVNCCVTLCLSFNCITFLLLQAGKPVAIIYPPVRDLVIQSSPCGHLYFKTQDVRAGMNVNPNEMDLDRSAVSRKYEGEKKMEKKMERGLEKVLPVDKFNLLYVGRLAGVKCPGVLVRALGYLLNVSQWVPPEYYYALGDIATAYLSRNSSIHGNSNASPTKTAGMYIIYIIYICVSTYCLHYLFSHVGVSIFNSLCSDLNV